MEMQVWTGTPVKAGAAAAPASAQAPVRARVVERVEWADVLESMASPD
jgi:hypothetical protein